MVLVQEYADGGDLLHHLVQSAARLSEHQVKKVILSLLFALDYLHKRLIIHRDLKVGGKIMMMHVG